MNIRNIFVALMVMGLPSMMIAQTDNSSLPNGKKSDCVVVSGGQIKVQSAGGLTLLPVLSNSQFKVEPVWKTGETPWFTVSKYDQNNLKLNVQYWSQTEPRTGKVRFSFPNGKTQEVSVAQEANNAIDFFKGDIKLKIGAAEASQAQAGEGIERSYDGDLKTMYHSPYGNATEFPITLTYTLKEASHLDYIKYIPRQDGQSNGHFGKITVEYTTSGSDNYEVAYDEFDCKESAEATTISLGETGIDSVVNVKITVHSGKSNFASCAEMEFYQYNEVERSGFDEIFTSSLCNELKPGVTAADLNMLVNPYARQLGYVLLNGNYDTKYRVAEFEAYEDIWVLRSRLKTSMAYNKYENPTGIYFGENDKMIIFAEGIDSKYPVSLLIKSFGDTYWHMVEQDGKPKKHYDNPEKYIKLHNGLNLIEAPISGNSYISYYSEDYQNAPKIKLHFAMGKVCGYFDAQRGDTNEDWKNLLANTCSDMVDVRTQRIQVCFPTSWFKKYCPTDAENYVLNIDSTIYYERDVMGLSRYGLEPKNRQFARKVWNGGMFADGEGAAADNPSSWMVAERDKFGFWGFGHELGHVNQIMPGFKWSGCGETTNNIYSAWVEFKLGPGSYRLETEVTGLNIFSNMKGGRFNSYLEAGVRQGVAWQLQCGPDYGGVPPTGMRTVPLVDYMGEPVGRDTTLATGNYDHFIKLCPLWQLQLYCTQAGFSPNVYAKVFQDIRTHDYGKRPDGKNMTNGQQQLNFMKLVCDSTGMDFLPFFEKAGMLKPIKAFIEDYGAGWNIIDQKQIDELKAYVAAKGYKKINAEVNYITALNWKTYKDQAPLEGVLNQGCVKMTANGSPFIKVLHDQWKNVVAFETYDKNDKLLRISMQGLGEEDTFQNRYTKVMFPIGSSYIVAVGWDGTRMKCYEKQ